MTTPTVISTTDIQMHNNIMAAGSRERPSMLATGRYLRWRSRFLLYIDTRPNGDALRKCILNGPYKPTTVVVQAVAATDDSPAIPEYTTVETPMNMSPTNKAHFEKEKEEFGKFTSHDGETMESYYTRFYKLTNEMIRNNLTVATIYHAPSSKPSIPTRSHTTTRYKAKEIAKPITPPSESASEEDIDPEQAQRDKDIQKNLALIAKYFKRSTNLPTTTSELSQTQETRMRIQLRDTDEEIDEQELEAHYTYMAKIQEVPTADTCTDSEPLEKNDQNDVESDDERVALANLIANLKLDVDDNKKIQK
nr:hypothetical protein [Tanacetum cinerariifolium]